MEELTLEQEFEQRVFEHKCRLIGFGFTATLITDLIARGREDEIDEKTKDIPYFVLNTMIPDLIRKGMFEKAYEDTWQDLAETLP